MSLVKLLSKTFVPSDVLQALAYHIAFETGSAGVFISRVTLEYMDVVVGSFREKRSARNPEGMSISDLKEKENLKKGHGAFIGSNIYLYRNTCGWFVGLDNPSCQVAEIRKKAETDVSIAYPAYGILQERLEKLDPNRDPLTGCLTRKRFYEDMRGVLKAMIVERIPLWIFYMDFNNFKAVNDILGHLVGDEVLKSIAAEIRSIFLGYGNVYRIGGDEFIGTAFSISRAEAESISRRIEKTTSHAPGGIPVSVAVGAEVMENVSPLKADENEVKKIIDKYVAVAESKMYLDKEKNRAFNRNSIEEVKRLFKGVLDAAQSGNI